MSVIFIPVFILIGMLIHYGYDLSLYFEGENGLIIILGCSHKGVENIINEIVNKSGLNKIDKIIGGMHLMNKGKNELKELSKYFAKIDPEEIYPLHCSGKEALSYFRKSLGEKIKFAGVGSIIEGEI